MPTTIDDAVCRAAPRHDADAVAGSRRAEALARLAERLPLARADRAGFLRELAECAAVALDVDRVAVWCFESENSVLASEILWDHHSRQPLGARRLHAADHPEYFAAIRSGHPVAISDTSREEARRLPASDGDVRAFLHAPIRSRGQLLGLVRYEQCSRVRRWTTGEEQFARSISGLLSLFLEAGVRAAAESSLRDSEERYRDLVETMEDVLYVVEEDGRVSSLNGAFERLLGWRREDWVGKHFAAFVHPDDLPGAAVLQEAILSGESPSPVEMRFRHAAGGYRVGELRATARREGGVITGVIGVGRDVTERVRAEARSDALLGIARDVAGSLDLERLFERTLGPTVESVGCEGAIVFREVRDGGPSRAIADVGFTPEQHEQLRALRYTRGAPFGGRLLRGETVVLSRPEEAPAELAQRVLSPLGVRSLVAAPLYATGRYYGALVAWSSRESAFDRQDVLQCEAIARLLTSAIGAAELYRIRTEEQEIEAVQARIAEDMISSLETPVLLERVCRATRKALGSDLAHAFLFDETSDDFVPVAGDGETKTPWEVLRTVRVPRKSVSQHVARLARDGLVRVEASDPALDALMAVYGVSAGLILALRRGGQVMGVLTVGRYERPFDQTDEHIARRIGRLASLALTNAKLVSQLEGANALKSQFVATMSHELRTPLNVILGYTDLLLDEAFGPLTAEQADTLARLAQSAANLCELVNATLDLSRLESGRIEIDLRDVPVSQIVNELAEAHADHPARVELRCETEPGLGMIRTDPGKLKVAIGNLVSNAFKFTEEGSVTLRAVGRRGGIEFSVRDTGPGIPPALQDAVFESFRQVDGSASRRHGGAGLGLYIVRQLVGVLDGTVTLESTPGHGATFCIWVPGRRPIREPVGRPPERLGASVADESRNEVPASGRSA